MGTERIKAAKIEPCCNFPPFKDALILSSTYQHNALFMFVPQVTLTTTRKLEVKSMKKYIRKEDIGKSMKRETIASIQAIQLQKEKPLHGHYT